MLIQYASQKIRKILLGSLAVLSAVFFTAPLPVEASSYGQSITVYDLRVTAAWAANTIPEAVDLSISYPMSFELYHEGSETGVFPESIAISFNGEDCGTVVKSGSELGQTVHCQGYTGTLSVPVHFSSYTTDEETGLPSASFQLVRNPEPDSAAFTLAFDDVTLTNNSDTLYKDQNYFIYYDSLLALLAPDALQSLTFSESSASGTQYEYAVEETTSSDTVTTWDGPNWTRITTVHLQYMLTNNAIRIPVSKIWYGDIQDEVTVRLLADGSEQASATLTEENAWTETFTHLDQADSEGNRITYTLSEDPLTGYETSIAGDAASGFTVTNTQEEPSGSLTLTAWKTVNSGTPEQSYSFCLLDADGYTLQTRQNDAEGTVQFDPISYGADDVGTEYIYQIRELTGTDENTTYDSSVYRIIVTPYLDPNDASVILADPVITRNGAEVSAITFNNLVAAEAAPASAGQPQRSPVPNTADAPDPFR